MVKTSRILKHSSAGQGPTKGKKYYTTTALGVWKFGRKYTDDGLLVRTAGGLTIDDLEQDTATGRVVYKQKSKAARKRKDFAKVLGILAAGRAKSSLHQKLKSKQK